MSVEAVNGRHHVMGQADGAKQPDCLLPGGSGQHECGMLLKQLLLLWVTHAMGAVLPLVLGDRSRQVGAADDEGDGLQLLRRRRR
jgi:hypothetical protein